jgi:2-polyprenyl-3-methyl-5-hydroxy-6-metoxy-1,4-benzoquinol methylase
LDKIAMPATLSPIKIMDIGCGSGDMLKRIAVWRQQKKINVELLGIDANPAIIEIARAQSQRFPEIKFQALNIWSTEFEALEFDIVVATLFLHHFNDEELVRLFSGLRKRARVGIIVNDIHRHWLAYHSIKFLTQLFSRSPMVKFDAPLSVLRAFKRKDLERILRQAEIDIYRLSWKWAFRWQLIIPGSLA